MQTRQSSADLESKKQIIIDTAYQKLCFFQTIVSHEGISDVITFKLKN